jgi:hypothetical protein
MTKLSMSAAEEVVVEVVYPAQSEEDEAAAVAAYPTQSLETSGEMFAGRSSQMNTKAMKCHVSEPMLLLHPVLYLERAATSRCLLRLDDLCPCLHHLLRAHLTLDDQSLDKS